MAKQVLMGVTAAIAGRVGSQIWKKGKPDEQAVLRSSVLGSDFIINMDLSDPKQQKVFDYVNHHPDCELQIHARVEGNPGFYRYYFVSAEPVQLKMECAAVDAAEIKEVFG